jgi:hypothetical protein
MSDEEAAFETEFDVRLRQQMPIRNAMQAEIEKMAMFDELVTWLEGCVDCVSKVYRADLCDVLKRARALQERSK